MHNCLSWLFVKNRSLYSLLTFIKNIIATKTPFILFKNLTSCSEAHNYSTRHATLRNFMLPKTRTNSITQTVLYCTMQEWNSLPQHITQEIIIIGLNFYKATSFYKTYLHIRKLIDTNNHYGDSITD